MRSFCVPFEGMLSIRSSSTLCSPVIFNGTNFIPPATALNFVPWAYVLYGTRRVCKPDIPNKACWIHFSVLYSKVRKMTTFYPLLFPNGYVTGDTLLGGQSTIVRD